MKPNLVASGPMFPHAYTRPEFAEGMLRALRAKVPERGVDRGEREARDRADGGGVRRKEEVLPDGLDFTRITADEARRQVNQWLDEFDKPAAPSGY